MNGVGPIERMVQGRKGLIAVGFVQVQSEGKSAGLRGCRLRKSQHQISKQSGEPGGKVRTTATSFHPGSTSERSSQNCRMRILGLNGVHGDTIAACGSLIGGYFSDDPSGFSDEPSDLDLNDVIVQVSCVGNDWSRGMHGERVCYFHNAIVALDIAIHTEI